MPDQMDTRLLMSEAIKKAAKKILDESRATPAPCGCAPSRPCIWHTEPARGDWPTPRIRIGARIFIRLPDGTTTRRVVTRLNPDGSFTTEPEPAAEFGWIVPPGSDNCTRCGDTNYDPTDRVCITCTPGREGHDPELLAQLLRLRNGASK